MRVPYLLKKTYTLEECMKRRPPCTNPEQELEDRNVLFLAGLLEEGSSLRGHTDLSMKLVMLLKTQKKKHVPASPRPWPFRWCPLP